MYPAFINDYQTAGSAVYAAAFYTASALTVFCAFKAIQASEIRSSVICFCLSMLGLAGIYGLLNSPFAAELQIIIMAVGASALLCQAYYLCRDLPRLSGAAGSEAPMLNGAAAVIMLAILFFLLKSSSYFHDYKLYVPENSGHRGYYSEAVGNQENFNSPYTVSRRLLTAYAFPLEITAVFIFIIAIAMSVCRQFQLPKASFAEIWQFLKTPLPSEPPSASASINSAAEPEAEPDKIPKDRKEQNSSPDSE
ncbi:NADH-quinone oxidoreductase subunit J [bacterium]|nr:NADH-quinone oxidoreductase subunit J [bacterium]